MTECWRASGTPESWPLFGNRFGSGAPCGFEGSCGSGRWALDREHFPRQEGRQESFDPDGCGVHFRGVAHDEREPRVAVAAVLDRSAWLVATFRRCRVSQRPQLATRLTSGLRDRRRDLMVGTCRSALAGSDRPNDKGVEFSLGANGFPGVFQRDRRPFLSQTSETNGSSRQGR